MVIKTDPSYEMALWYRNQVTSHYGISEITELTMNATLAEEHTIYLHENSGNASYLLGEQVLLGKLAEGGKTSAETALALRDYGRWVEAAARYAVDVHHDFSVAFFNRFLPGKIGTPFAINPEPHLVGQISETALPVLWDFTGRTPKL